MKENQVKRDFTKKLLQWYAKSDRPMPWKGEKNPYLVWLSEIILQQTRVEQGWPYFEKFREKYPKVEALAEAPEDEVMKLWEGLGYYSRARNLHFTAKHIAQEYKGIFPKTYEEILSLKGVGPYTASAIASFAYGLPHAVVDGNVYRVLSRCFGIDTPIDSTKGKKEFNQLADELLHRKKPGEYNQAIIDFGATHCMPKNPMCGDCALQAICVAFKEDKQGVLPVKEKKIKKRTRYFQYLIVESPDGLLLHKRVEKDIWQNLYEFPVQETEKILETSELIKEDLFLALASGSKEHLQAVSRPFQQMLSHQKIIAVFWEISLSKTPNYDKEKYLLVERKNLSKFAFPKIIDRYLQDKSLYLKMI